MKLDRKDRIIMSMIARDPFASQEEIARNIGLSQPSVAARMRKLREGGAIETRTGMDPFKIGLHVAKVDVTTTDPESILDMFRGCPYFVNGFSASGRYNLCLLFMSRSIPSLEALVNHHLRSHASVTDIVFNILIDAEKSFIVPVVLPEGDPETPPCGNHPPCQDCPSYKRLKCPGCPAITQGRDLLSPV